MDKMDEEKLTKKKTSISQLQWNLRSLRSEFKLKNTEIYFRRYQTRLCHRWFTIVLILNIIVSLTDLSSFFLFRVSFNLIDFV